MTAKDMIELFIHSTSGSRDDLDAADPESVFKHQLTKGKAFKRDAVRQYMARDLSFNTGTDPTMLDKLRF